MADAKVYADSNTRLMRGVDELLGGFARAELFRELTLSEQVMALEMAKSIFIEQIKLEAGLDPNSLMKVKERVLARMGRPQ